MAIGFTNPTGVQFNDKFWSKVAVREAKKNIVFSQIGDKMVQPKHYGEKMVKYHNLPILHKLNINDQGIDANGVSLVQGKWYAYDSAGAMTGDAAGYADVDLAKTAAGATGSVKSGDGNLFGGDTDYSVIRGAFPALREQGGNVNRIGMTRKEIEATVTEFGFYLEYTKKMVEMDTEKNVLRDISREAGTAQAELREAQVQADLLAASAVNRVFAGDASTIAEIGADDLPTFEVVRSMELSLKIARSPKQTKMLTGSTKIGTSPIAAAYTAFNGYELNPTLQDMKNADGEKVYLKKAEYAAAGTTMQGEHGMISETRFIEVEDMQVYVGQGADSTDAADDVDVANRYVGSNGNYNVYPILYVGEDSFGTVGFEGDTLRLQNAKPRPIPGVDPYGKTGTVAATYYYGMMITRPERIRQIACSAKKS